MGEPGLVDEILATEIADNEDRVSRAELHFRRESRPAGNGFELLDRRMEQLDSLILGAVPPGREEYARAMRIARSLSPWRLRIRRALPARASTMASG
jgi:hypothetical protein